MMLSWDMYGSNHTDVQRALWGLRMLESQLLSLSFAKQGSHFHNPLMVQVSGSCLSSHVTHIPTSTKHNREAMCLC